MAGIAIVAIPEQDDPVWKVSSEKVPHLTLLYLEGPLDNEENAIRFIQHAANRSLSRFGLSVDRRGTLGADNADVVFLDKRYGGKELLSFRGYLLTNTDILSAYRKAEQYPIWTPHVTLGYPESPANKVDDKLHWINFDRIAVWTGDYVGPEFMLEEDHGMEIDIPGAWSDDNFSDFLEHFGVRGMKWGVRRTAKNFGGEAAMIYAKNRDAKWTAKVEANPKLGKISAKAARQSRKLTKKLKKDYKANGLDIKRDRLARARYDAELKNILEVSLDRAAYKVHKNSPSRLSEVAIHRHPDGSIDAIIQPRHNAKLVKQKGKIAKRDAKIEKRSRAEQVREERREAALELQQAAPDILEDEDGLYDGLIFHMTVDDEGFVDNVSVPNEELYQSDLDEEEAIEHGIGDLVKKITGGKRKYARDADGQFAKTNGTSIDNLTEIIEEAGYTMDRTALDILLANNNILSGTSAINNVLSPESKTRGHYNPDAKLDTSQVVNGNSDQHYDELADIWVRNRRKKQRQQLKQSEFATPDDVLMHFGVRGMKWGVRRATGPDGLALGRPPGVGKSGGKTDTDPPDSVVKIKRGKGSADHQRMVKNLDKKIENLSTADIKAISARIEAINKLKTTTAAEKAAKASMGKKLVKWALGSVRSGVDEAGSEFIKKATKSQIKNRLPDPEKLDLFKRTTPPTVKKAAQNVKTAKEQAKTQPHPPIQDVVGRVINNDGPPAPKTPERQLAIETLVKQIERAEKEG